MPTDDGMVPDDEYYFYDEDVEEKWCADAGFYCDHGHCYDCLYHI